MHTLLLIQIEHLRWGRGTRRQSVVKLAFSRPWAEELSVRSFYTLLGGLSFPGKDQEEGKPWKKKPEKGKQGESWRKHLSCIDWSQGALKFRSMFLTCPHVGGLPMGLPQRPGALCSILFPPGPETLWTRRSVPALLLVNAREKLSAATQFCMSLIELFFAWGFPDKQLCISRKKEAKVRSSHPRDRRGHELLACRPPLCTGRPDDESAQQSSGEGFKIWPSPGVGDSWKS